MKVIVKIALLTALLTNLNGCGWLFGYQGTFRDHSNDYRQAKVEALLEIPDHMDSNAIDDNYAIPQISDHTTLDDVFKVPAPEPLGDDIDRDAVRINTLGNQHWILVDGTPGQVWPRLRGFLSLNQLEVQRVDAVNGMIETGWLQPSVEGALRERYRLRIDQGVQRGTSEVYVLQVDIRAGKDDWPKFSSNSEREELMIRELAQYLADSAAAAAVSMLAQQAIDSSGKITLEEDANAQPFIRLQLPFTRAWASVGQALSKAGYTIDDMDRSQRVYYLHYLPQDQEDDNEPGFFAALFSWDSDNEASRGKGIAYYLRLNEQDPNTVMITIERQSGEGMNEKEMNKGEAEKLLKLIKRHIS
ncbi:MAG: outer membrane protein assembly factor BamC [Pseudomonadales bacterium]